MTTPSDPHGPGNYPPPPPGGEYQPQGGGGYGAPTPQAQNNTPLVLSIIGVVCWFLCSPAAIVLGLIGQSKARQTGQSDTFPKVVWIVGIIALIIGIISYAARR